MNPFPVSSTPFKVFCRICLSLWSQLKKPFLEQVRESIGVTLSVLCSNIRLQGSCNLVHPHEVGTSSVHRKVEAGNWDHYLVERASELVVKIQNFSQSDTLDVQTDRISDNGVSSEQSHDDVKWMETVQSAEII